MGFEKRFYGMPTNKRLKMGGLRLLAAGGTIIVGMLMKSEFGKINEYGEPTLMQNTINKYQNEYNYKPNSSRIKSYHTIDDITGFVFDALPYLLIAGGVAAGVSGLTYITNTTYRKK